VKQPEGLERLNLQTRGAGVNVGRRGTDEPIGTIIKVGRRKACVK